jgi:hypothetical protein
MMKFVSSVFVWRSGLPIAKSGLCVAFVGIEL